MRPTWVRSGIELWHADCFDVFPEVPRGTVDLVLADLPYGTTACNWDSVLDLKDLWDAYKRVTKPNAAIILTAAQPFTWKLCQSNPEWFRYELIWEKPNGTNPLLTKQQPFRVHENILIFYNKLPTYHPQMETGLSRSTAFEDMRKTLGEVYTGKARQKHLISRHRDNAEGTRFPRSVLWCEQDRGGHPTKKPVALMRWLIRTYSNPGDLILDNTMGFGTTGVACVQEARQFLGIEKTRHYYDKAQEDIATVLDQRPLFVE